MSDQRRSGPGSPARGPHRAPRRARSSAPRAALGLPLGLALALLGACAGSPDERDGADATPPRPAEAGDRAEARSPGTAPSRASGAGGAGSPGDRGGAGGENAGAATRPSGGRSASHERTPIELPEERRLRDVRMLTDGGENAEAYWSWDGTRLVFQAKRGDQGCDRILVMDADGSNERVLADEGAHTCAFFLPGDERIVFSSTRTGGRACPTPPDRSRGYVWPLFEDHEIWSMRTDGTDLRRLTSSPGYDAEATVRRDGRIVFTSVRDGDLDIYTMAADGSDVTRLTDTPGYDGGPFFSPDGSRIVYRAHHPTGEQLAEYRELLRQGLIRPGELEVWVMDADGSNQRPVTDLGGAAFAPYFTPDGRSIIFSSNHLDPRGRDFDLFVVGVDGGEPERITWSPAFDGFPMFSPDGRRLAFCSNRGNAKPGETNVFVADWVADLQPAGHE